MDDIPELRVFAPDQSLITTWTARGTTDADAVRSGVVAHAPYGGPDSTLAYHLLVHWPKL